MATERLVIEDDIGNGTQSDIASLEKPLQVSIEEKYLDIMRKLRFGQLTI